MEQYDVIVAGSGAGGLSAAITAADQGLSVLVIEKADTYGGTTARSGGWIWIPNNAQAKREGIQDSAEKARTYIETEAGNQFDAARVDAFIENGPKMLDWFDRNTEVQFTLGSYFPDYHPGQPGGLDGGRSLNADPVNLKTLGKNADRLAPPIPEATFMGMMVGSNRELKHFFEATRSVKSFGYVGALLARYGYEKIRYGKTQRLTNGTALVARLAKSAFDRGVEIRTGTPLDDLVVEDGRVTGIVTGGKTLKARKGVVLATGGFPFDMGMRKKLYRHAPTGEGHFSPASPTNTGDAMRATAGLNAAISEGYKHPAAWVPISLVPRKDGTQGTFPHFVDRGKPGVIAVLKSGKRFVNEANSYHDYGEGLIAAHDGNGPAESWLIIDHPTLRYYGLGFVKPYPIPLGPALRSGYLKRGKTLRELAQAAGIDPAGLEKTVTDFNRNARETGDDPEFGRGSTAYNRYLGDPDNKPNPCVKPIETGPFYAIRVVLGDLGSFVGHRTDASARVLTEGGDVIPGLYAVGNDAASLFGGNYSGGGITLGPAMTFGFIAGRHLAGISDAA
ncbi:FAD-dependent oxidoreductase [Salipiger sp. P9]|uniref:FAD-dependent oxidoreductase n=1 Tax=Salipiger pentaromativorans TaxID=2943193 RepID=UPI002157485B|nr:FAD-dependent oxidoreductase [Salipiger pentaromativorans]MCR8550609.1 FAD-dependent oxidoreductase [Salipiger pentaromativorans]